jgi:hypothetical protein
MKGAAQMRKRIAVLGVGAVALLGVASSGCTEELEQASKAADKLEKMSTENPELDKQVRGISLGTSVDQVQSELGTPDSRQEMNSSYAKSEYLYYGKWQLTFTDGSLDSKNKY